MLDGVDTVAMGVSPFQVGLLFMAQPDGADNLQAGSGIACDIVVQLFHLVTPSDHQCLVDTIPTQDECPSEGIGR